jgi:CBS domain-containing protein
MLAGDLAVDYPVIQAETEAVVAVRLLVSERLPGLVVLDDRGTPITVVPAFQVARFAVPKYVQIDPALARVFGERQAEQVCAKLAGKQVRDLLPEQRAEPLVVEAKATVMQVAALMERERSPLVAVVDERGGLLGAITLFELLEAVLPE